VIAETTTMEPGSNRCPGFEKYAPEKQEEKEVLPVLGDDGSSLDGSLEVVEGVVQGNGSVGNESGASTKNKKPMAKTRVKNDEDQIETMDEAELSLMNCDAGHLGFVTDAATEALSRASSAGKEMLRSFNFMVKEAKNKSSGGRNVSSDSGGESFIGPSVVQPDQGLSVVTLVTELMIFAFALSLLPYCYTKEPDKLYWPVYCLLLSGLMSIVLRTQVITKN